jgi:hypothetical protein
MAARVRAATGMGRRIRKTTVEAEAVATESLQHETTPTQHRT